MYFSRLKPNLKNSFEVSQAAFDDHYKEHQVLWNLFPHDPNKERDFLFRFIVENNLPVYYILSEREPVKQPIGWQLEGPKEYQPVIKEGLQLHFSLRVNPVVTRKNNDKPGANNKSRHDVVMELRNTYKSSGQKRSEWPPIASMAKQAGLEWLEKRQEKLGFTFLRTNVLVEGYHRIQFRKKGGQKPIQFGVIDFSGILTVSDEEKFRNTLYKGVGKGRGFGCGLLLIKKL